MTSLVDESLKNVKVVDDKQIFYDTYNYVSGYVTSIFTGLHKTEFQKEMYIFAMNIIFIAIVLGGLYSIYYFRHDIERIYGPSTHYEDDHRNVVIQNNIVPYNFMSG